jgi:hypothetical protein
VSVGCRDNVKDVSSLEGVGRDLKVELSCSCNVEEDEMDDREEEA